MNFGSFQPHRIFFRLCYNLYVSENIFQSDGINLAKSPEIKSPTDTLIISLLGPSGSGKSTLAQSASEALADRGISSVIIKKDAAIKSLSAEKFGNEWRGYTPLRSFGHNRFGEKELNSQINSEIKKNLGLVQVIFLEGGTRTREAVETSLRDVDNNYLILKMSIATKELLKRLQVRRREITRKDDNLAIMIGKLIGQHISPKLTNSPKEGDLDVVSINANQPPEALTEQTLQIILKKLGKQ